MVVLELRSFVLGSVVLISGGELVLKMLVWGWRKIWLMCWLRLGF